MSSTLAVDEWIDKSLDIGRKQWGHYPWPAKGTFYAWRTLKGLREPDDTRREDVNDYLVHDSNLACAEHYMFARWIVSLLPEAAPIVTFMATSYQFNKLAGLVSRKCANVDVSIKFGRGPTSPPSAMQLHWEMRGIERGLIDSPFIGPLPNPAFGIAMAQEIVSFASDKGWTARR